MYSGMQRAADHSVDNIIMDNRFRGTTNETYERYVFNTRRQKTHETVDDYVAALCTLASTCNFCDCLKDSLLRDRIVLGIKHGSTRKRLLQEADLNLETCIAMCRAAEAASPSQPVKTETWTEDTTAVQAASVSSGDQRPGKKQDFPQSLRPCDQTASNDEVEISEVNFNTELDDDSDDDSALQWTTEHQSSDFPQSRTGHYKLEPAWSMEEDSPDQPSAVYSTAQPVPDNTSLHSVHECYLCSAAFVLVSSLELHLASVHGEKLDVVLPGSSTPDRCDAGNCSYTHRDNEVDTGGKRKRKRKKKVEDSDADDVDEKKRCRQQHVCDVCGKAFSRLDHLRSHKLFHSDARPFVCDVCSKSFTQAFKLKRHKLTHAEHKPFLCDVCSKSFANISNLTRHKRIHTGERPYKCPQCHSGFKQSGDLQLHVKSVHQGARPHLCDLCGAAFSKICHLKSHRRIHTGEKPYTCSNCGKGFADSSTLRRHLLTHTGNKPHACLDCGKSFSQPGHYAQHCLTHTGQKSHSCPLCPLDFTRAHSLKIHVEKKHQ